MTLRRSDVCVWLLAGSLLAAAPVLAQKKTNKPLTPEQQAERAKFDPKAETSPFGGSVVEESVAQVNDQIISTSDYKRAESQLEDEGRKEGWSEQDLEDHKRDLLRDLIDQQLLLSRGKDLNITGETELVKSLDNIRKQNHLDSLEDLEKAAAGQGVSYEDFKQHIRNDIITHEVIRDEVGRRIQMTDAQLQQYYRQHLSDFTHPESVRLSEILIPVKTGGDETANLAAAKAKADELDAKIKGGASFEDLAKANSAGSTAAQGGDLGEWMRGKLAPQLEDATFALQAGQSTAPIRTKQGYVILKVVQHTPGGAQPFEAVRPQVEEAAFTGVMQPKLREYLSTLRQNAYIDVRPGYVDTAAAHNSSKPLYSAYAPPGPKKKVHFKRTRYTGAHRGRHAGEAATETATNKTGATASPEAAAKTAAGGTTTALANTPAVEKPGKK
ncbi:MAG TPA: peptidylprolyl isomerase, partial [Acidobacteriaceae bacterium]|nr:peptidylprolyl isomerase [Acidobacteriaceae bacterium]